MNRNSQTKCNMVENNPKLLEQPSKLFLFEKAPRRVAGGLRAGMEKGNGGQVSLLCVLAYGGVGAEALLLGSMKYKCNSEDNEDEDMNLQKTQVYKKM